MNLRRIVIRGINPEPWTSPTASAGRAGGRVITRVHKNPRLRTYQEALIEELEELDLEPLDEPCEITFYFWRCLEQYEDAGGRARTRNRADATNLQKATEDALQADKKKSWRGIITNDRLVRRVESVVVEQEKGVDPMIVVVIVTGFTTPVPQTVTDWIALHPDGVCAEDQSWTPGGTP